MRPVIVKSGWRSQMQREKRKSAELLIAETRLVRTAGAAPIAALHHDADRGRVAVEGVASHSFIPLAGIANIAVAGDAEIVDVVAWHRAGDARCVVLGVTCSEMVNEDDVLPRTRAEVRHA